MILPNPNSLNRDLDPAKHFAWVKFIGKKKKVQTEKFCVHLPTLGLSFLYGLGSSTWKTYLH